MDLGLAGREALVVGGSAGIGLATARLLAAEGASVTIASRDAARLREAAASIGQTAQPAEVAWFPVDVTADNAEARLTAPYGDGKGLDILIVTVGGSIRGRFDSFGDDAWHDNYNMNVIGPVRTVRALLPSLGRGRSPAIVLLGAAGAKMPYVNQVVSNVHKAGLLALVKTLSHELAPKGIRVNAISPGRTLTRLWLDRAERLAAEQGTTPGEVIEEFAAEIPLGRFAEPDEIAQAVVFVASGRASYITGQSISVDGGIGRGLL
ncbi:MAG: SDR family oxidoreductase [Acidimicrobiaceae bacterium]|nr:SDR family oxidoreductase [Acidimicrobiaceae bacterium]MXW88145.1 SDR family oxidoreductase [Acidimicrobiaceae bacterium]MYA15007.1 SDR family oxidoreductase [Acidimicrobiaceae bacterium]MYE56181.1 SDR family oxidoreductase [Acidimicrobiaceae bacterium]MYE65314.1 SDR family oxidoreductase [Acidimicrobiaceae bacterium]